MDEQPKLADVTEAYRKNIDRLTLGVRQGLPVLVLLFTVLYFSVELYHYFSGGAYYAHTQQPTIFTVLGSTLYILFASSVLCAVFGIISIFLIRWRSHKVLEDPRLVPASLSSKPEDLLLLFNQNGNPFNRVLNRATGLIRLLRDLTKIDIPLKVTHYNFTFEGKTYQGYSCFIFDDQAEKISPDQTHYILLGRNPFIGWKAGLLSWLYVPL